MDNTLKVTMNLDSTCDLYAVDESDYESLSDLNKHAIVEVLTDKTKTNIFQRIHLIVGITDPLLRVSKSIKLERDGTYTYYRFIIPQINELYHGGEYKAANKYFAVGEDIYFSLEDFVSFDEESSYIRLVENYLELWDHLDDNYFYWFNSKLFSICRLNDCITKKISQWICEVREKSCKSTRSLQMDFLLEASFAIKYLVEQSRFDDAQRILDSLTSCGSPCENLAENHDCGCGKPV